MQSVISAERPLGSHKGSLSLTKFPIHNDINSLTSHISIDDKPFRHDKSKPILAFSKKHLNPTFSQEVHQNQDTLLNEDYVKVIAHLSTIEDPLWKIVCWDIINMMGPASLLKVADSLLGETCVQSKNIEILCKTEEIAQFIQQYDFVILGSLHPYFPALKQLRVKIVPLGPVKNKNGFCRKIN